MIIKFLNCLGRYIEFLLTGQSDFKITTSEFEKAKIIDNEVQAKIALQEVRVYLKKSFSINLVNPVVIKLGQPQTWAWKLRITSGFTHIGNYCYEQMGENSAHMITIVPGLEHEMLRNFKGYKEGMARWVEYHFLLDSQRQAEAKKISGFGLVLLGNMLNKILLYEKKHGRAATCRWLASMNKDR